MSSIRIVFDGPPGHESGRFVEVEDETGHSINVGEWIEIPLDRDPTRLPLHALQLPDHRDLASQIEILRIQLDEQKSISKGHAELLEVERTKLNYERAENTRLMGVLGTAMDIALTDKDRQTLRELLVETTEFGMSADDGTEDNAVQKRVLSVLTKLLRTDALQKQEPARV